MIVCNPQPHLRHTLEFATMLAMAFGCMRPQQRRDETTSPIASPPLGDHPADNYQQHNMHVLSFVPAQCGQSFKLARPGRRNAWHS
jgi:hypothetical protein